MMKNLWFVSSFILVLISCNPFICKNIQTNNGANINAAVSFSDTLAARRYKAKINYKTTEITGILICKKINNSTLAGVFINEFGIKGFDFTLTETGAKMGYVFKNLDKWYIRKTLERDLHFMFSMPKVGSICTINDTAVYVVPVNRNLRYVYHLTNEKKMARIEMWKGGRIIATKMQYTNELSKNVLNMRHTDGVLSYKFCEINKTQ